MFNGATAFLDLTHCCRWLILYLVNATKQTCKFDLAFHTQTHSSKNFSPSAHILGDCFAQRTPNQDIKMSDLIELLSDLAPLESTSPDMDQHAMSLLLNIKEQLDDLCADLTMSVNIAVASRHNDGYSVVSIETIQPDLGTSNLIWGHHQDSAHYGEFGSSSQRTESTFDSMRVPSPKTSPGLGVAAESRSGAMDAKCPQVNSNGNGTHSGSNFESTNRVHSLINALDQGLSTQLTDIALERRATTGPYYVSTSDSSISSPTSTGLSTISFPTWGDTTQTKHMFPGAPGPTSGANYAWDSAVSTSLPGPSKSHPTVRRNATQMKRALSEASSRFAVGGQQKRAKSEIDPVRVPQP